jgi:hypothetical protein
MVKVLVLSIFLLIACETPKDVTTTKGAWAALAPCVDSGNSRCLYEMLDRDSQWSIQTIFKALGEMHELVETSYPADRKAVAFGSWEEEATASDPAGLFDIYCKKKLCLEKISKGFGAVTQEVTIEPSRVRLKTTRNGEFELIKADDRWGLSLMREELATAKIRILDRLREIEKNAAAYEEQRRAGVEPIESSPLEQTKRNSKDEH